ncbi:sterile alpha motif domain-containing protein 3-like [Chanodichthys erythropterus]|uniref:sterile alpha motif domain-containing protein 3-like n=1 Tax=Chanodichthys erythropterus TaxID=933992 RepID=UPI00351F5F55
MISKIFPKMKDQVRFIRLQQSLKTEMPSKTTHTNHETSVDISHGPILKHNIAQTVWPANYQLPKFPLAIQKKLDEESRDFFSSTGRNKWRSKVIQTLFDQMCTYTWYPTSEQYNKVCSALVAKYQFLRDRTGRGYESWHEVLKNKFKKERSPLVDIEEINSIRSRFSRVKKHAPSIQASDTKKATNKETEDLSVIQDMSQKRQRSEESVSGEDKYSIGIHLEKIRTECLKKTPNIRLLQDCMERTRNERADYMKNHSTKEILLRYPALKIPSVLVYEFESILDGNIENNILKNLDLVAQKVINECQRREVGVEICAELGEAKKLMLIWHTKVMHRMKM